MELPYLWKHLTHCKFFQCDTSTFGFIYNSSNEVNLWLQIWFFLNPREFEFDSINSQTIWLSFDLIPNSDDEGNTCHIHEFRRYIHCLDATSSLSVFFPRCKSVHSRETVSGSFCRNPIKVRTVELLNPTDFSRSDTILVTCNYSIVLGTTAHHANLTENYLTENRSDVLGKLSGCSCCSPTRAAGCAHIHAHTRIHIYKNDTTHWELKSKTIRANRASGKTTRPFLMK